MGTTKFKMVLGLGMLTTGFSAWSVTPVRTMASAVGNRQAQASNHQAVGRSNTEGNSNANGGGSNAGASTENSNSTPNVVAAVAQATSPQATAATPLTEAFQWLNKSSIGKEIFDAAQAQHIPIREGVVSKTEMTATHTVEGKNESMKYAIQVLIARDKDPIFQALDMAHELTHATHPNSNPFDPNLNAQEYVRHGIEGDGGEAQAIMQECRVGRELLSQMKEASGQLVKARCQFVWKTEADVGKWKNSFYQLGQYYQDFVAMVSHLKIDVNQKAQWTKRVESRSPLFASAVTHKPYPLALLEEYIQITQKICEKASAVIPGRNLASANAAINALSNRCQSVQNIP